MAKKTVKLNDKVNKKNKKGMNIDKYETDESKEVKRFIIILFSIIIVALGVYFVTRLIDKNKDTDKEDEITAGEINYDKVSVGTMLGKSDSEYYVIIYDGTISEAVYYSAVMTTYMNKEKSLPVYYCDLNNKFNKEYYAGRDKASNPDAKATNEFMFGDLTLIKVKNGKVDKYIESLDTIKEELGL